MVKSKTKNNRHRNSTTTIRAAGNIGLAIWRLKCYYETFVQGSTAVILLNFCAKNPPHRQAENRCGRNPLRYFRPHRLRGSHRLMCSPLRGLRTSCAFAKFSHGSKASCENFAKPPSRWQKV